MSIKNKLRAGIIFLFLLALLCSGTGAYYLQKLADDSKAILKDNYRSLSYVEDMAGVLDSTGLDKQLIIQSIQQDLTAQQGNLTERGERQLTDSLQALFDQYKAADNPAVVSVVAQKMRANIYAIMKLNRNAIERKGKTADDTANHALIIIALIGAGCFMIGFTFMVNFPDYIATPITRLAEDVEEKSTRNEAKTNFIATISHELKTPIASIKMSLKLLEDERIGAVNTEQRQLIGNIGDDTRRLLQITGELLDMAQIETGNIKINFGIAHPKDIIDYAVKAVKFIADQRRVNINVSCDNDIPNVRADLDKTTWVLINLLSNAIKYSPEISAVELTVTERKDTIEFSVRDHGHGIEPQYLSRIFDRYFKVPGATAGQAGTGLGLAIAKDFIEAQSGKIGVESEIEEGSRFYFLLPVSLE
ncbi:HAMP domain-containing histidine kinase [Mucilaginibacter sp. HMF5004]|uniref:sensor histidine kinase n=1 Tax=Mucilaginibacter rivuli TaxID=2857527 RepID=UPI001C5D1F99|nr:HAMP domain-containing sensor histidine kinase [Mucilaginibacter rivuli]MBW4890761.1 HAMP domain-containing histidine kinase [Mucilaginibacter rivuli]